jgi:hypothetical protein
MWIVKGTFLGISIFAVGAVVFLLAFLRSLAGPGQQRAIGLTVISHLTVYNVWFWAAFAVGLVLLLVSRLKEAAAAATK